MYHLMYLWAVAMITARCSMILCGSFNIYLPHMDFHRVAFYSDVVVHDLRCLDWGLKIIFSVTTTCTREGGVSG